MDFSRGKGNNGFSMEWLKKIFQGPTVVKSDLINSKLRQRHSLTKLNKQISNYNIHGAMLFTPS